MIAIVVCPTHFASADAKDIERELTDLVLRYAQYDAQTPCTFYHPVLRQALTDDPDRVRIAITHVRSCRYHPPSKPGWVPFQRVRWGYYVGKLVEVKWLPLEIQ